MSTEIGWRWNEDVQLMEYLVVKSSVSSELLDNMTEEEAVRTFGPECVTVYKGRPGRTDWPNGEPESVRVRYDSARREGSLAFSRVIPGEPGWSREGC